MSRPFILCADDFGLTPGVNAAILDLAGRRRLSAVSAMVTAPAWAADAPALRTLPAGVELGLHLTFTEFAPLTGASSLAPGGKPLGQAALLAAAALGRLAREDVRREIARQIEAFADAVGRRPDYLDGHHHAHQFPRLGAWLAGGIAEAAPAWRPWLRVCAEPLAAIARRGRAVLDAASAALLGRRLRARARALGIATNLGFSGFYDVRRSRSYARIFPAFLRAMGPRHLVVCHPGRCAGEAERRRPWMRCREDEYEFIGGPGFADLCAREGVRVAAFGEIAAPPR